MPVVERTEAVPRRIPDAFPGEEGRIPNNPLIAATLAAIFKGGPEARRLSGGWTVGEGGQLFYWHVGRRGGEIHVRIEPEERGAGSLEEQWGFVEGLTPLTADVLLAVLAQLCEPSLGSTSKYPILAPVPITANAILKYKDISCWGKERTRLRANVVEEMDRLRRLRLDVHEYPAWDPTSRRWNSRGVSVVGDKIFDVVKAGARHRGQEPDAALSDVVWLTRIGHWGQWWLNAQAKVWLGPAPLALLRFDHRSNRRADVLAKKIGMNTIVLWGVARPLKFLERRIDHLLQDIGELPVPDQRGPHWAGRTRDRFDEALLKLQLTGTVAAIEWPDGPAPGRVDRAKGWVARWLSSKMTISLSAASSIDERTAVRRDAQRRHRANRKPKVDELEIESLRSLRSTRGISQLELARELGISASYLSQIETGKKPASNKLRRRMSLWAASSAVDRN